MKYIFQTKEKLQDKSLQFSAWLMAGVLTTFSQSALAEDTSSIYAKLKKSSGYDHVKPASATFADDNGWLQLVVSGLIKAVIALGVLAGVYFFITGIIKIISLSKQNQPIGPGAISVLGGLFCVAGGALVWALSGQIEKLIAG